MPRSASELTRNAIAGILIVIVVFLALNGMHQSSANASSDTRSHEGVQDAWENFILGMAILGILGTFGTIAYYYRTINFGLKKVTHIMVMKSATNRLSG